MLKRMLSVLLMVPLVAGLGGCAGTKSFSSAVRAGDTVALSVGWNVNVSRSTLSATITPPTGGPIEYAIGNPAIRAVMNTYPDPMSRLIVGTETSQSLGYNANTHGASLSSTVTNGDKDLSQTMVILDLPATLPVGTSTIVLKSNGTPVGSPLSVVVLAGTGASYVGTSGSVTEEQLRTLERASGSVVTFTGSTVPYAIHLELNHGAGTPWVVNPRGDVKNIAWHDSGSVLTVILTPVAGQNLQQMVNFKFSVAGLTGLSVKTLKAYDSNGNLVSGVGASSQDL